MLENPSPKFKTARNIARFCLWLVLAFFTILIIDKRPLWFAFYWKESVKVNDALVL